MAEFSYLNYLYEITKLAAELPTDFGEAWDRFRADVAAGKANDYNTAGLLPDFDFAEAGARWKSMTDAQQEAAREEWRSFLTRDLQLQLLAAYKGVRV